MILFQLFSIFFLLKVCFFPNYLNQYNSKQETQKPIATEFIHCTINP
ncbi:MAG: DUF4492 domain-containing protein [Tannerellaceae bacterium]|nr:DUF4492 domain-containing protein [Tannerellaceae bacterium]